MHCCPRPQVLRFRTSGIISAQLMDTLWPEFAENERELLREVMIQRRLMVKRSEAEFTIPSCLPATQLPEPPIAPEDKVIYVNLDGFVTAQLFPQLAARLHQQLSKANSELKSGPPQLFSNRLEARSAAGTVHVSLFPVAQPKLLRIHASSEDLLRQACDAFHRSMGFRIGALPLMRGGTRDIVEELARRIPCLKAECPGSCELCRLAALLEERFQLDLSPELRGVISEISMYDHTRPSGSFRFKAFDHPGDVDLSEQVVLEANTDQEALEQLAKRLQEKFGLRWGGGSMAGKAVHWAGLKTGDPTSEDPNRLLTWTLEELQRGKKEVKLQKPQGTSTETVDLVSALACSARGRTAKIDIFAKTRLFQNRPRDAPRFFEITNVLYVGRIGKDDPLRLITPVSKDGLFIQYLEEGLKDYSAKHPKAVKYAGSSVVESFSSHALCVACGSQCDMT